MPKKRGIFRQFLMHTHNQLQVNSLKVTPRFTNRQNPIEQIKGEMNNMEQNNQNIAETVINTLTEIEGQDGTINITAIGCGNAGSRVVDILATKRNSNNKPLYTCLAINSNEGDLKSLQNIPQNNRINLNLGGMGKNPRKGLAILNNDLKVRKQVEEFVISNMNPVFKKDDQKHLIILFAGLGGGTGTATILKLVEDFLTQNKNKNLAQNLLDGLLQAYGLTRETVINASPEIQNQITEQLKIAIEKYNVKIGIVAFLPDKHISDLELEMVQEFTAKLWDIAKPKYKNGQILENQVSFISFPDNQHFADLFKETLTETQRKQFGNMKNFANYMVANTIHELNTIPKASSETTNLDGTDFQTVLLDKCGYLSMNKNETLLSNVSSNQDIVDMFMKGFTKGHLHSELELITTNESNEKKQARIFHTAITTVIDESVSEQKMLLQFGEGRFVDEAKETAREKYLIDGMFYEGYIKKPNNGNLSVYTLFKTDTLPIRITKGLAEEIKAAKQQLEKATYTETTSIEVNTSTSNQDYLSSLLGTSNSSKETETPAPTVNSMLGNLLNNTPTEEIKEDISPSDVLLDIVNRNK